jgi:hypothetical protein
LLAVEVGLHMLVALVLTPLPNKMVLLVVVMIVHVVVMKLMLVLAVLVVAAVEFPILNMEVLVVLGIMEMGVHTVVNVKTQTKLIQELLQKPVMIHIQM